MTNLSLNNALRNSRHLIATVLLIAMLWAIPMLASAQSGSGPVEVHVSDEFGYLFWWDTSEWAMDGEEREAGSDWVRLANNTTFVDIWGFVAPGATADDCLNERIDAIAGDPDLVRLESLHSPGTPPTASASGDGLEASSGMVLAYDTDEGRITIAASERCIALVPGQSLLLTSEWMLAEAYNANYSRLDSAPLGTITRIGWHEPAGAMPFGFGATAQILADDGEALGLLTGHGSNCLYGNRIPVVVAENTGGADLEISPFDFIAVADGVERRPASTRWLWPSFSSDEAVILATGDIAILELDFGDDPTNARVVYLNPRGPALDLVGIGSPGCGGGGAPIVIDME